MKSINNILITSLAILLLASCSNKKPDSTSFVGSSMKIEKVAGIARIEPEKGLLYICSNTNGIIEKINSHVNNNVKQGRVLVKIENSADIALLNLEQSKTLAQKSAIHSAQIYANTALADLKKAERDFSINKQLYSAKAITEQTLYNSKALVDKLLLDHDKLLSDVEQTKNKLVEINAAIQYQKAVLNSKQIRAPYNGKVLSWDIHKGDYVTAGQKLGQFAPEGALIARVEIDELFAEKVKTGMKANIISQLNGEKTGEGEVIFIADFLKKKSLFSDENTVEDRRVKEVLVRLTSEFKPVINNRVNCIIYLNK